MLKSSVLSDAVGVRPVHIRSVLRMSKKPTQKKTPFVIEPLNWVAPDAKRSKGEAERNEEGRATTKREDKD